MGEENKGENFEGKDSGVEEETNIPPDWAMINFQDLFDRGFRPRVKSVKGLRFITLRRGDEEKSLGPYTESRWNLLTSMYPVKTEPRKESTLPDELKGRKRGFLTNVAKIPLKATADLPRHVNVNLKTILYYEWVKSKGFPGDLGDFLNQVCEAYFGEHGIEPVMVIAEKEYSEKEISIEEDIAGEDVSQQDVSQEAGKQAESWETGKNRWDLNGN